MCMCHSAESGGDRPWRRPVPTRLTPAAARQLTEAYRCLDDLLTCRHHELAARQLLTLMQRMQRARRLM